MESQFEQEQALRSLILQIDEGIDEWILNTPQSRFAEAQSRKSVQKTTHSNQALPTKTKTEATQDITTTPQVNFDVLGNEDAMRDALREALPQGLQSALHRPLPDLGTGSAEIGVIIDPPYREAVAGGALDKDPSTHLLLSSLRAIHLDINAETGREPRAHIRFIPISPWRMPQDRKFLDAEAALFLEALEARLALFEFRAIFYAGSNLAGLEADKEQKIRGIPAFKLISPRAMLKEPMLKRLHWQKLLDIDAKLEEILKI